MNHDDERGPTRPGDVLVDGSERRVVVNVISGRLVVRWPTYHADSYFYRRPGGGFSTCGE